MSAGRHPSAACDGLRRDPLLRALLWRALGSFAFRMTFHNWNGARRIILRLFGARLTPSTKVRSTTIIDRPWNLTVGALTAIGDHAMLRASQPITIGNRCTVSQMAILTTEMREALAADHPLRSAPITIDDDAWVAADALVLPGVHVKQGSVIGARSLVETDIEPWQLAVGQPARPVRPRRFVHGGERA